MSLLDDFLNTIERSILHKPELFDIDAISNLKSYLTYSTHTNFRILTASISNDAPDYYQLIENIETLQKRDVMSKKADYLDRRFQQLQASHRQQLEIQSHLQIIDTLIDSNVKITVGTPDAWYYKEMKAQAKNTMNKIYQQDYLIDGLGTLYDLADFLISPSLNPEVDTPDANQPVDLPDIYEGLVANHYGKEYKKYILKIAEKCYETCHNNITHLTDLTPSILLFDLIWTKFYRHQECNTLTDEVIQEINGLIAQYKASADVNQNNDLTNDYPKFKQELSEHTQRLLLSHSEGEVISTITKSEANTSVTGDEMIRPHSNDTSPILGSTSTYQNTNLDQKQSQGSAQKINKECVTGVNTEPKQYDDLTNIIIQDKTNKVFSSIVMNSSIPLTHTNICKTQKRKQHKGVNTEPKQYDDLTDIINQIINNTTSSTQIESLKEIKTLYLMLRCTDNSSFTTKLYNDTKRLLSKIQYNNSGLFINPDITDKLRHFNEKDSTDNRTKIIQDKINKLFSSIVITESIPKTQKRKRKSNIDDEIPEKTLSTESITPSLYLEITEPPKKLTHELKLT